MIELLQVVRKVFWSLKYIEEALTNVYYVLWLNYSFNKYLQICSDPSVFKLELLVVLLGRVENQSIKFSTGVVN